MPGHSELFEQEKLDFFFAFENTLHINKTLMALLRFFGAGVIVLRICIHLFCDVRQIFVAEQEVVV